MGWTMGEFSPYTATLCFPLFSVVYLASMYYQTVLPNRAGIMPDSKYLFKRGEVYYYKRKLPTWMQDAYGVFFTKSLKTRDIREARNRRDLMHTEYLSVIREAEDDGGNEPIVLQMAKELHALKGSPYDTPEGNNEEALWSILEQYIQKHQDDEPELIKQATKIMRAAPGSRYLDELLRDYERECAEELTKGTVHSRMQYVNIWADSIGRNTPIHSCLDPDDAWEFVKQHIRSSSVTDKTKNRRLNTLVLFFDWLISQRVVTTNPFASIRLNTIKGRRGGDKTENGNGSRAAWKDDQLRVLLAEFDRIAQTSKSKVARANAVRCKAITRIALYTGMRLNEICSLQVEDCSNNTFSIREGKTAAAIREVPIHSALVTLLDDLIDNRETGPLITDLVPGGPDNRPGWNLGKAFGRVKCSLGFPPELVFHSLRHTFITALERAEVSVILIERLVGHKINNLAFGTYSKGQTIEVLREAVEKVDYEL
jgi:integrase